MKYTIGKYVIGWMFAGLVVTGGAFETVFTVTDEERGLYNMHPELVKEQIND